MAYDKGSKGMSKMAPKKSPSSMIPKKPGPLASVAKKATAKKKK